MKFSFNLIDQPWIPCIKPNGDLIELGIRDTLFRAGEFREISADSPIVTLSLHRLLLAILHRIFGPANRSEWEQLWIAKQWNQKMISQYLLQWEQRFDLFDPTTPFYQDPHLKRKPETIAGLVQGVAAGNDATLFNHRTEESDFSLSPAQAARTLITVHTFGLAGLKDPGNTFTDSTCSRVINFLVQGRNLFETLILNLYRYPLLEDQIPHTDKDRPSWEWDDPFIQDQSRPYGYLDYLTWMNRRILFIPEQSDKGTIVSTIYYEPGLRLPQSFFNPDAHYRIDEKKGAIPLRFNEGKRLWRDSTVLFEFSAEQKNSRTPYVMKWLNQLVHEVILPKESLFQILAFGMCTEPGKDKVYFLGQENLPLPFQYLENPKYVEELNNALILSKNVGKIVWGAINKLIKLFMAPLKGDNSNLKEADDLVVHTGGEKRYWAELESPFKSLIIQIPQNTAKALEQWKEKLNRIAWIAFDQAVNSLGDNPRVWKALPSARRQLANGLYKQFHPDRK